MQLIARDEFLHQGGTHYTITRWLMGHDDPDMTAVIHDLIPYIHDTMRLVCEQEMKWSDYLFQYGSIIGLNANILKEYLKWLVDVRTKDLLVLNTVKGYRDFGYKRIFDVKENPILLDITLGQIDGIINFLNAKDESHKWDDCVEFNRRLDATRDQSFCTVTPEFKPYV
jgi:ribonucleotide reductase beta subunit family protein with ferritin-like domain